LNGWQENAKICCEFAEGRFAPRQMDEHPSPRGITQRKKSPVERMGVESVQVVPADSVK